MATIGKNQFFEIKNGDGSSFHNLVLRKSAVESIVMSLGDKISGDVYYKDNSLSVTMHEYITYNGVNYMLINPPTIVREGVVSDNSELRGMTKYSFVFYHPMCQLSNFPFTDVAVTSDETRYLSESKVFSWIGKPADFVAKLNKNLTGTEWIVELSSRFPQDKLNELSDVIPFDNATIADACKTFYDTWGVPYVVDKVASTEASYAAGKRFKLVMGLPSNEIYENAAAEQQQTPFVFQMGHGVGLKNNSRTPRNNKIITRISGYGSENNIPYGYPQVRWYGTAGQSFTYGDHAGVYTNVTIGGVHFDKVVSYPIYKGILNGEYVELIKHPFTRTHLMPSVYRTTLFNKISFYDAAGEANTDYDPDITLVDYYDAVYSAQYPYPNTINLQAPSYESHEFEDEKPELGEAHIISATPLNNDLTPASSWDDSLDDEGNYKQSYFQMVLPQLSFDLYACASITEEMQINMRSGACLGCTFTVQVDWDDYKRNFYDEEGNFAPNGSQRDLTKYPKSDQGSIALILQKDNSTFGTLMPNMYQYPKGETSTGAADGDTFVILGISLPESYIFAAEWRLDADMKSYMLENNVHYFDYPLKFDEDFLFHKEYILSQIRPNTVVRFNYAGQTQALFVKQITVKYGDQPLPQYDITLTDNVEVVLNKIGQVAEDVEKLSTLIAILRQSYGKNVWSELAKKLSKTQDDTAAGYITMLKGLQIGANFVPDILGEGGVLRMRDDGKVELVIDILYARVKAYFDSVEIREYQHTGGNRIASVAGNKICRVAWFNSSNVELEQTQANLASVAYFRCYFRASDGEDTVRNNWVVGDQAYCHITSVTTATDNPEQKGLNQKHLWRLVIGRNTEGTLTEDGEAYIDLSNRATETISGNSYTGYQSGSDIPAAQDDIIQLGNVNDTTRQGAIVEFVTGTDAPSYQIYQGISSFSLNGKNQIGFGYNTATGKADMKVYGDAYIGDRNRSTYIEYKQDDGTSQHKPVLNIKANVTFTNVSEMSQFVKDNQNNYDDSKVKADITILDATTQDLQKQIDGAIETWFMTGVPTLQNAPANEWTTDDEKDKHIGDLYYDKATTYAYRFLYDDETETYGWQHITDDALAEALRIASEAQETADGKRTVYSVWEAWMKNNVNTLEVGDLFIPAANTTQGGVTYKANKVYKCTTDGSATFQAADYIDDAQAQAKVDAFVSNTYNPDKINLQSQIDGKAETFRQAADPSSSWTDADKPKHVGDLWMDISAEGGNKTYIYLNTAAEGETPVYDWVAQNVPDEVFDEIDGKSTIFGNAIATPPTDYKKDDMWLLPAAATINGTAYKKGDVLSASQNSKTYDASHWSKKVRYTDDTKADSILNNSYYQQLTGGTISQNITNAANAASAAQSAAKSAQSTANAAQTSATAANNKLNTWADDGVISPTEKLALKNQKADVEKEYAQIIVDAAKYTGVSTTAFTTAYNRAITAFNYYTADSPEDITIITDEDEDTDATPRYSRISAYYAARQTVLNDFATAAKKYAADKAAAAAEAFKSDAVYRALKSALGSKTDIVGGLVLTSLIGMRQQGAGGTYTTWGGISGEYNANVLGGGMAAWYGGGMVDKETLTAEQIAQGWNTLRWAKGVDRFDGSGYRADGNITWDEQGRVSIKDVTTIISNNNTDVLNELITFNNAFHFNLSQGTSTVLSIEPQAAFTNLYIRNATNPNAPYHVATENWVDDHYVSKTFFRQLFRAFKPNETAGQADVEVQPNTIDATISNIKAMVGFWTEQYVSALGNSSDGGGGGASVLYGLNDVTPNATGDGVMGAQDGYVLTYNGSTHHWYAAATAETYVLPQATADTLGGIKIGYAASGKNYAIVLDANGKAYVNVPWTDTTYTLAGLMGSTAIGGATQPIYWDGTEFKNTTYTLAKSVPADAKFTDTTYSFSNADATLAWSTRTKIATTGGTDIYVTMPANPNTNTWRNIYLGGTSKVGTATNTKALNFLAGSNIDITYTAAGTGEGKSGSADYFNIEIKAKNVYDSSTSRTKNTVLAAPNGSNGAATFRALVAADIPSLAASKITSGTFDTARIPTLAISKISGLQDALDSKLDKSFFHSLFRAHKTVSGVDTVISANGDLTDAESIEAMFGFWTEQYISSLGQGSDGGGGGQGDVTWDLLAHTATNDRFIDSSYISGALASYSTTSHTHTTTIAADSGTNQLTLAYGTKYKITAGGTSFVFTMPSADDTNTWRNIYVAGTEKIGSAVSTKGLNFAAGSNVSLSFTAAGSGTGQNANYGTLTISATDTTYSNATQSAAGLMSAADKKKLDGIAANANNYSLPLAASGVRGGIQIGYTTSGKNYAVQLSSEKAYVNVPWTDTTYSANNGVGLNGTTFYNSGVRAVSINNSYLRVNTNGTNADLTIPYATTANQLKSFYIPYNRPVSSGGNGKQWERICTFTDTEVPTRRKWYGKFTEIEFYTNGYGSAGNYTYLGRVSFCVRVGGQTSIKNADVTIKWQDSKKDIWGVNHFKAVVTDTSVEFFVLDDIWDTAISAMIIKNDGLSFATPSSSDQYTESDFTTYYSGKTVIDAVQDTNIWVGNALNATKLQTSRTINGTSFDGSANITTANWGTARNISIADSDSTNTGSAVSVNGSAAVTLKLPSTIKATLSGNASTATTLKTSRTIWGQSFNGSANVSGNMTGVGNITMASTDGTYIQIGGARIVWDNTNKALKVIQSDNSTAANFYATGAISALGQGVDGGGGGGQGDVTWDLLKSSDTRQINISHLAGDANYAGVMSILTGYTTSGKNYAVQKDSNNHLFVNVPWEAGTGTVTSVKVGSTSYTPTNGVISLPAYPTSLPASDVYSWAKAASKPSYTHNEIGAGDLTIGNGANRIYLRTEANWATAIYHNTSADEAVVFLNKGINVSSTANYTTSWIFAYGNPSDRPAWNTLTPALQIKGQCVTINKLLGSKVGGSYNLDVNGSANATTLYENGNRVITTANIGSQSVNYASSSGHSNKVLGSYTSSGGQQNPNYFGTNRVGFLMMNTTVNGNSQYKDWVIMDCYNGNDVGGGVAIGVNRQSLGAYIMRSAAARTSWDEKAELCGTHNSSVSLSGSTLTVKIAGVEKSLTNTTYSAGSGLSLSGTTFSVKTPSSGAWFGGTAYVNSDGVMEVGRYIDFHPTSASTLDFNIRLDAGTGTTARTFTFADTAGTLLSSGNSSVSLSGSTLTVKINGVEKSLTNTNTWRGIQDNLTSSTNTTESLSAKQGYLLANGSARDNTKLPLAGGTMTGSITMSQTSSARTVGIIGTYDPNRAAAIWAMGSSYQIKADGTTFGSLYGAAYAYFGSGYTFDAGYSGSHSFVWAQNGTIYAALGDYVWAKNGFKKNGSSDSYVLLGGGGHLQISDSATNSTIAKRTANGYLFATYLNQSSGAETPTESSYWLFANSDGYFRKSTRANLESTIYPYEAKLQWGGRNFSGGYGCVDAAMVPELGANRAAFCPASAITIQYSTNGGTSWSDYGASNAQKLALFSGVGTDLALGKNTSTGVNYTNYRLRVIINTGSGSIYSVLNKFVIYISTNGSSGTWCTIDARLQSNVESGTDTWTTFASQVGISGWSGYNVINTSGMTTYGNTKASQYGQIRFTFGNTGYSSSYSGMRLYKIFCFGGVGWTTPSTMAKTGHLYSYNENQRAFFPEYVSGSGFIKSGSSDDYFLLGGGGHVARSNYVTITSSNRAGVYRLYRRDDNSNYSVQTDWTGSYWRLRGYSGDTFHAECQVGYASSAGNATTAGGLAVHSGRNNEANKIVRTDGSGYIQCGWINTTSGNFTGTPDRIWASNDAYMRYMTPANFFPTLANDSSQLSVTVGGQNRKLTIAYATSAGSCSGNAASATTLQTSRTIWGQSFNGSANVSGALTGVTTIDRYLSFTSYGSTNPVLNISTVGAGTAGTDYISVYVTATHRPLVFQLNAGNVGVGVAQPTQKLDVAGGIQCTTSACFCTTSGNVGIGTASPTYKLHVVGGIYSSGDITTSQYLRVNAWTGYGSGSVQMWYNGSTKVLLINQSISSDGGVACLSDARHKQVIRDTNLSVEQIANMPSVIFKWTDGKHDNDLHVGTLAQSWQQILPEVVGVENNAEKTLNLQYGVAALVAAITTARKVVDHEARIKALEKENKELREEISRLKIA